MLGGGRSYVQNTETLQRTRINYEEGQYVVCACLPSKAEEAQEDTETALKGNRSAILERRAGRFSAGGHGRVKSA